MWIKLCPDCNGTCAQGPEGFKTPCPTCKGNGAIHSDDPADKYNELVYKGESLVIVNIPPDQQ